MYLACSAGKNGWLVCLQQIYQPPYSKTLQQRLLHSGENLNLQDAEDGLLSTEQPSSTEPKFTEKDCFCWYHPSTDKANLKSIF